jgi:multicomponent Na+:H+ antiporter subunit G
MTQLLAYTLVTVGATLIGVSAVGLIRMPDVYNRTNAVAKASSLGTICVLLGVMLWTPHSAHAYILIPAVGLQLLTAPISGFAIGRAAHHSHAPLTKDTHLNELGPPPGPAAPPGPPSSGSGRSMPRS